MPTEVSSLSSRRSRRSSNIELCRIFSILCVLLVHSQFYALGMPRRVDTDSVVSIVLEACGIIGVNAFIMISGYFSIRLKLRAFLNLGYICLFCAVVTGALAWANDRFQPESLYFLTNGSWFVRAYIGLMILSPVLNAFADRSTRRQLLTVVTLLLVYQTWFAWKPGARMQDFAQGYSILSFCVLYLLMRCVRRYDLRLSLSASLLLFAVCTGTIAGLHCLSLSLGTDLHQFDYNNPLVILSAFAFFQFFLALPAGHWPLVNHLAQSTLSVLLLHNASATWPYVKDLFRQLPTSSPLLYLPALCGALLAVLLACTLIDQLRLFTFARIEKALYRLPFIVWLDNRCRQLDRN